MRASRNAPRAAPRAGPPGDWRPPPASRCIAAAGAAAAWISTRRPSTPPTAPVASAPTATVSPSRAPQPASLAGADEVASALRPGAGAWSCRRPASGPLRAPCPARRSCSRPRTARAVPGTCWERSLVTRRCKRPVAGRAGGDRLPRLGRESAGPHGRARRRPRAVRRIPAGVGASRPRGAVWARAGPGGAGSERGRGGSVGSDLLRRFPHSVYDGAARRRLDELTR